MPVGIACDFGWRGSYNPISPPLHARRLQQGDTRKFTREWFAWANTLFAELILTVQQRSKRHLSNIHHCEKERGLFNACQRHAFR